MPSSSLQIAALGEKAATAYLEKQGYQLLCRNYRTRAGEIDIICEKYGVITFIEVKTRRNTNYGMPAEAVYYRKQQKIIKTAMLYLSEKQLNGKSFQFDVMEVFIEKGIIKYNHIENAFGR